MGFRFIFACLLSFYSVLGFADDVKFESLTMSESLSFNESHPLGYKPSLDPTTNCDSWEWWCDIKFGVSRAVESGVNGLMINGYAYHLSAGAHWPTGYVNQDQLNEITPGVGYTRTFYNSQYNTEYILYAMVFADSWYKPEAHIGYAYQKYFDMTDSGKLKWGIGYTPFVFIKPSMTNEAPIPIPALGIMSSLKYDKFSLMVTYFNVLFFNARVDF